MRPGLYMIFNGMMNFLKFTVVMSVCGMMLYFIFRSFINGEMPEMNQPNEMNQSNGMKATKTREPNSGQGGIKYFQIPVTKLTDESISTKSRKESGYYIEKSHRVDSSDCIEEDIPTLNEKTIRYTNFVNMAGEH